jgi:hypothetical protein
VIKRNDYSEPISEKTLARKVTNARSSAKAYLNDVFKYLNLRYEDYPLWKAACNLPGSPSGGIKITSVEGYGYPGRYRSNGNSRFNPPNNYYPFLYGNE